MSAARHRVLPPQGTLLVSTDVHGNAADFDRMRARFEKAWAANPDTHWAILGDVVHGPDPASRQRIPELYDYDDASFTIVETIAKLRVDYPDHVHFVLGNHDWAHVGGPRTAKFWPDEAQHLEDTLEAAQIEVLRDVFRNALLFVVAPCGAFLSHASPGALPETLDEIDAIPIGGQMSDRQRAFVTHFTTYYGQREAVTRSFLEHISSLTGTELTFLVHGHDRDEAGWFAHENTQLCPVIFGAPRENRRYLRLDLAARYNSLADLRDGVQIRRLWADDE